MDDSKAEHDHDMNREELTSAEDHTCPECGGQGELEVEGGGLGNNYVCPACGGTGVDE